MKQILFVTLILLIGCKNETNNTNVEKNKITKNTEWKTHRAGFQTAGIPSNIAIVRSLQQSLARSTAMTAGKTRLLKELEDELARIKNMEPAKTFEESRLKKEITELRKKI